MSVVTAASSSLEPSFWNTDTNLEMPLSPSDQARSELIEQLFERVEAESARRAEREAEADAMAHAEAVALYGEATDSVSPVPLTPSSMVSNTSTAKQRRRGSVSVSRFGMPTETRPEPVTMTTPLSTSNVDNRPSRSSSIVLQPPKMYSLRTDHGSADSLASNTSEDPSMQVEDRQHSSSMATIAGKQSISRAISSRLTRTRSQPRSVLTSANNSMSVIIGVAVEEATIEHRYHEDNASSPRAVVQSVVQAPQGIKRQRSSSRLSDGHTSPPPSSPSGILSKAKEITMRFKRKSLAALSQLS